MKLKIDNLTTEKQNKKTMNLDMMTPLEIVTVMNEEDHNVPAVIQTVLPEVAEAVDQIAERFQKGGRLFYVGAGTSGRLGVLDAAECVPTFGTDPEMVQGLIAGGGTAMVSASEGAEDNAQLGHDDLVNHKLTANDSVVGIAASGRTPYVIGALKYAQEVGALTVSLACNLNAKISEFAEINIEVSPGPEVLTGSTRLKAGSCQKMILNMISTGSMVRIGKTYGNMMVDVQTTNEKLVQRAINMVVTITGVDEDEATKVLHKTDNSVKLAIVMILADLDLDQAKLALQQAKGVVRKAIL